MKPSLAVGDGLCPRCGTPVMRGQSFCARCHASFSTSACEVPRRGVRFWLWVLPLVILCGGAGGGSCFLIWKAGQEELAQPHPSQAVDLIGFLAGIFFPGLLFALMGSVALGVEIWRRWREERD